MIGLQDNNTVAGLSISDSAGNTWVVPTQPAQNDPPAGYYGTAHNQFLMAYAVNAAAVSSVTINFTTAEAFFADLSEYSNIAATNPIDVDQGGGYPSGTGDETTPTITTANANDLIIGGVSSVGTPSMTLGSASGSYTLLASGLGKLGAAYQVVSSTGSYAITFTPSAYYSTGAGIMAFKQAGGGGGGGSTCTNMGFTGGSGGAISLVSQQEVDVHPAAASYTMALNTPTTTGNALILIFSEVAQGNNDGIASVTDSAGNTWTIPNSTSLPSQNPPDNWESGGPSIFAMAYVVNAQSISSITVSVLNGTDRFAFDLAEFSNIASVNPVDQSASAGYSAATAQSTPTITTTNANDLIIGGMAGDTTFTPQGLTNYTMLDTENADGSTFFAASGYQVVSSTGSYYISWLIGSSASVGSGIMAFEQGTGGGSATQTGSATTDLLMRGGDYFCNGAEQGFFWATG